MHVLVTVMISWFLCALFIKHTFCNMMFFLRTVEMILHSGCSFSWWLFGSLSLDSIASCSYLNAICFTVSEHIVEILLEIHYRSYKQPNIVVPFLKFACCTRLSFAILFLYLHINLTWTLYSICMYQYQAFVYYRYHYYLYQL